MSALRITNDFGSATLHAQWIKRRTYLPWRSGIPTSQSQSNLLLLVSSIYTLSIILRKQEPLKKRFQHVPNLTHPSSPSPSRMCQASGSRSHLHTNCREKVCCPNHNRNPLPGGGSGGCSPPETARRARLGSSQCALRSVNSEATVNDHHF